MATQSGKRISHSRFGCATCRRRRVRCDERKDTCTNCDRLNLSCSWYRPAELSQRSRVNTACDRCRAKKIKCTSSSATGPCAPCQLARVTCVNTRQSPTPSSSDAPEPTATSEATRAAQGTAAAEAATIGLPGPAELSRLLDAYFDGPHYHCFYSFVHQPTFLRMFESGLVPGYLILIVIATSLHFLEPQNPLADQWADECRRLVMLEIFSPPSTATLQALILLQRYEWHRASHVGAWFLSALAVRLAHGLQLNIEIQDRARVPVTVREIRRRLTWSCFIMESMIEGGRKPLSGLEASSIEVKLPCNERSFQMGLETNMPDLQQIYNPEFTPEKAPGVSLTTATPGGALGISAFLVKLTELRRDILNWTLPYHPRNKGHFPSEAPWSLDSPFFRFESKLEKWEKNLPEELRCNPEVIYRRRSQLISFVTLHCLYHGCYCDLYRIGSYLTASQRMGALGTTSREPPQSFLTACRRGRLQNALAICDVISQSMKHRPSGYDPVVGISASLAIRILVIERQQEESEALGLTEEAIYARLDSAIQCAKWIAQRSVPIRDLFSSVCTLARQRGLHVDLSGISLNPREPVPSKQSDRERENSPSLRTYGTFGSIQTSLAIRNDVHEPAASSVTDKESDLFNNFRPLPTDATRSQRIGLAEPSAAGPYGPSWDPFYLAGESTGPGQMAVASGWGDGTLNFSMMPLQFDWINQSLGGDFNNDSSFSSSQALW